jgi:hypothetical protein
VDSPAGISIISVDKRAAGGIADSGVGVGPVSDVAASSGVLVGSGAGRGVSVGLGVGVGGASLGVGVASTILVGVAAETAPSPSCPPSDGGGPQAARLSNKTMRIRARRFINDHLLQAA